ncbi:dihydrodipicolinate synthase family protein [Bacteroidota bacterium]
MKILPADKQRILEQGHVFVPSPLALDENKKVTESHQRLLTLYYIRSGATAVIPGAHTGEFALNNLEIYSRWLTVVKEMTDNYGNDMLLMAAIGGKDALKQAEMAAQQGYDIAMVAPTAFTGMDDAEVINIYKEISSMIPAFGFELQRAIPGAYRFTPELWDKIFEIAYGAKGASFDTYRSLIMLEAAAKSTRKESLTILTGNDDRIVSDLLGTYTFNEGDKKVAVQYGGGLLGHFATDTHAVSNWVGRIFRKKQMGEWDFPLSEIDLAHAVNYCNMVLFDALGNFENSVWGVKYRLTSLGLLPGPYCHTENGRKGQAETIDRVYGEYPNLCDEAFLRYHIEEMKKEVGL